MPTDDEIAKANADAAKAKADQDQADLDALALGEKGKAAIKAERDARRAADADREAAQSEARRLQQILDKQDAEKRKADEDAAAKRGEFEALATAREGERDAAIAERDGLKADNDALRAFFDGRVDAALKDLPDALKDFDPGPDAPFAARRAWLEKALKRAGELGTDPPRGNGPNPKPNGAVGAQHDDAARAANARRYG